MGKTFIGLGDDATAAVSNPAGLSNLLEQEFSFEFTGTQIKHQRFFERGRRAPYVRRGGPHPSFFSYVVPSGARRSRSFAIPSRTTGSGTRLAIDLFRPSTAPRTARSGTLLPASRATALVAPTS